MKKWIIIGLAAPVALYVLLFVFWVLAPNIEAYRGRYKLTVSVEVDGVLKKASSVYEVSYSLSNYYPYHGTRGTMPYLDLGEHGTLVLLFNFHAVPSNNKKTLREIEKKRPSDCREMSAVALPTHVIANAFHEKKIGILRAVATLWFTNDRYDAAPYSLPAVLIPKGGKIQDAQGLYFCDIKNVVGVRALSPQIFIEKTDDPALSHVPDPPPWLVSWRNDYEHAGARRTDSSIWPYPYPSLFHRPN